MTAGYVPTPALTPQSLSEFNTLTNRISVCVYDTSGNMLADQASGSYQYDAENRQVSYNSGAASYEYDGEGQRVKKVVGGETTVFVYNAGGQLVAEYTSGSGATNGTSYLTSDHLGSTRIVTGQDGSVKTRRDYCPFGEELPSGVSARSSVAGYGDEDGIQQKFTGKERDDESGLDYFGARYFSSPQGRFTSTDPMMASGRISKPQSWNRYSYVLNNPLRFVDPEGLEEDDPEKKKKVTVVIFAGGSTSNTSLNTEPGRIQPGAPPASLGEASTEDNESASIAQQIANDFPDATVILSGSDGVTQIANDLITNTPDSILIYGFSSGANSALGLTNVLTGRGINVDQVTTVDPAGLNLTGLGRTIGTGIVSIVTNDFGTLADIPKESAGLAVIAGNEIRRPAMVGDAMNFVGVNGAKVGGATNTPITPGMRQNPDTRFVHTSMDDIASRTVVSRIEGKLSQVFNKPQKK